MDILSRRVLLFGILLVFVSFGFLNSPAYSGDTGKKIKIGVIGPMKFAAGKHNWWGAEMAADEINAAGGIKSLGGAKIKGLTGDSEGKPASGMAEAERLIRAGARILIGADMSHVSFAVTSVAEKHKVCTIVPMSVADEITEILSNDR